MEDWRGDELVTVITSRSPLGQQLVGKKIDDEVKLGPQLFYIIDIA